MNVTRTALIAALALGLTAPAFAQSNPTTLGTEGPNSNSSGYPSGQTPTGRLSTTQVGPQSTQQVAPAPKRTRTHRRYRNPNPA